MVEQVITGVLGAPVQSSPENTICTEFYQLGLETGFQPSCTNANVTRSLVSVTDTSTMEIEETPCSELEVPTSRRGVVFHSRYQVKPFAPVHPRLRKRRQI